MLDVLRLLRPKHWSKNVFVLAPLVFSESLFSPRRSAAAAAAFVCFCLWSSAIYLLNDVVDAAADRQHPRKCRRPVASGRVAPVWALVLALFLAACAATIAGFFIGSRFLLWGTLYLANGIAYCFLAKQRVIADVMVIAIGFVVRLVAGCAAVGVEPSTWLIVCGFSLAMTLGFGKRRVEVSNLGSTDAYRASLTSYSEQKLDTALGIGASICIMSYMLYTVAPETVQLHHTKDLMYTVPFVAYGVLRYIFKVQEAEGDGPVDVLLSDPVFFLNGLLWLAAVVGIMLLK